MLAGLVGQVPEVTAPGPARRYRSDPRFELHEASDLAVVHPEVRFEEHLDPPSALQGVADGALRAVLRPEVPLEGAEQRAGRGTAIHGAELAQLGVLHPLCGPSGRTRM